jgi:hypothetical protein
MNTFAWPDQWCEVCPEHRTALERELSQEISSGHALFGLAVHTLARREDCDDVLFAVVGSVQVAQVHLAYRSREIRSDWPTTVIHQSLSEWRKEQK